MRKGGQFGFALLLILCGGLILLNQFGLDLGWLMGYVVPIAMMVLGWFAIQRGNSMIGWILVAIGAIILLGKLSGWILAIAMIGYGIYLLRNHNRSF